MTTAERLLAVARKELGVYEYPPGSNRTKFGKWYGVDGPWCAMFVSWVFEQAGIALPKIQQGAPSGFAYCPYGRQYFKKQGLLVSVPQPGDIVFFNFGGSRIANHIGIVESVNLSKRTVTTIEGNTSRSSNDNGGKVMRRIRKISICFGFARPRYSFRAGEALPRFRRLLKLQNQPYLTGEDIKELQKLLKSKGYPIEVDGVFGPRTDKIVRDFQQDQNLEVDGAVGEKTWEAVKREFGKPKINHQQTKTTLPSVDPFATDILARTIYGEGRFQTEEGKFAIAHSIKNRVESPINWWGDSIVDVCRKPHQYGCWSQGRRAKILAVNRKNIDFESCYQIAKKVVSGETSDPSNGATHYYDKTSRTPLWATGLTPCADIGSRLFFNQVS